jgi:mannose-1-phosphate guanylyltransferase
VIAVVLVGGTGTRLRPITLDRPKPMLPIAGRPFLSHLFGRLAEAEVDHVILSCCYLPDAIRAHFGDGGDDGPRISYVVEDEPLGTAGAIRLAARGRVDEPFLALNGDVLTDLDVRAFRRFHAASGSRATIALTPVTEPERYGLVLTDRTGAVAAFREKPGPDELADVPEPYRINAGAYVLDPTCSTSSRGSGRVDRARGVPAARGPRPPRLGVRRLLERHRHAESYLAGNLHVLAAEAGEGVLVDPTAVVDPAARLVGPAVIGPGAAVEARAEVARSVVGAGSRVEADAPRRRLGRARGRPSSAVRARARLGRGRAIRRRRGRGAAGARRRRSGRPRRAGEPAPGGADDGRTRRRRRRLTPARGRTVRLGGVRR